MSFTSQRLQAAEQSAGSYSTDLARGERLLCSCAVVMGKGGRGRVLATLAPGPVPQLKTKVEVVSPPRLLTPNSSTAACGSAGREGLRDPWGRAFSSSLPGFSGHEGGGPPFAHSATDTGLA